MGIDLFCADIASQYFDFVQNFFHLHLKATFNLLTNQTQSVAIGNRLVVIVFVERIPEEHINVILLGYFSQQWRSGECNFNSFSVIINQVSQIVAFGIIAPVRLVQKIDALYIDIVIYFLGYSSTFGEPLNVDNGDFLFSAIVTNGSCI